MAPENDLEWNIGVFCHNEAARVGQCIDSIAGAIGSRRALVTLVLNGTSDASAAVALQAARAHSLPLAIYRIPYGDKSNAINQFFYTLRAPARLYVCVDGYVRIGPHSFEAMQASLAARPGAVAATGIPINGRTIVRDAREILEVGGRLQGTLYALRPDFIDRMVARNIRLPIGLYRGDGLLGSMAAHDLDAVGTPWENGRIVGVAEATFEIQSLSIFSWRDLRRHFRRKVRQMRGLLENAAIKTIIYRNGFAALPLYADEMIAAYLREHAAPPVSVVDRFFMWLALRQHKAARPAAPEAIRPEPIRAAMV